MKSALTFTAIFLFAVTLNAQTRTIGKDVYEKAFRFAVSETNRDYPFIFKVTTAFIENGKTVRTVTDVRENQSPGHERIKTTDLAGGRETVKYQMKVGFGNVFCSDDGASWTSTKYECSGPAMFYGPREAESVEYSLTEKSVDGKKVAVYREYSVFAPSKAGQAKEFREKVSTIDSRGYFMTVVETEGTLGPRKVTLKRTQSWVTRAEFEPVVAPKQIVD